MAWQAGELQATVRHFQGSQQGGPPHLTRSSPPAGRLLLITPPADGVEDGKDLHTIAVDRSADGKLGFSVRGGSEHGLSVFVSRVDCNSPAEQAGLCVGDMLVEVNGVSLEGINMSSALKVLLGNNRLRVTVRRIGKVPAVRYSTEKTTWVDLIHRRMVVEENGRGLSEASSDGALTRTVHLCVTPDDYFLGFNIRGGKEFGLGIYVSKMDPGGLAEQSGIKMGDQILAANGVNFEDIDHSRAVDVLRSHPHLILVIKEAGRYPAYKEIVAEYTWHNKLDDKANKLGLSSSSQFSDSTSSILSLSSETPPSSLTGQRQFMSTKDRPGFGVGVADLRFSTDDLHRLSSGRRREAAFQAGGVVAGETSRSLGPTLLLRDTAIRSWGVERSNLPYRGTLSPEGSPKTAALTPLSEPSRPIRRSRSQVTVSEDKQKRKKEGMADGKGTPLRRSKTFVSLLFKGVRKNDSSRGRSMSPSSSKGGRGPEVLALVERMAHRLLDRDEASAVVRHCERYVTEHIMEDLLSPLLALLDRPEKLLLLREIRMLIPPEELEHFDNVVSPLEEEAYDILKSRAARSPVLRPPHPVLAPRQNLISPVPDYRGGFQLQPAQDQETDWPLLAEMGRLRLSGPWEDGQCTARAFRPLQEIPVDGYSTGSISPKLPDAGFHFHRGRDSVASRLAAGGGGAINERGRSRFRNGHPKGRKDTNDGSKDTTCTVLTAPSRLRPALSQAFGPDHAAPPASVGRKQENGVLDSSGKGNDITAPTQDYELVTISKARRSLGISISGGVESKVQPVIKVQEIFPGGAAATCAMLKAGMELVSVDGDSLQGVTHQQAVDIIRRAFCNKVKDLMVFVVKMSNKT